MSARTGQRALDFILLKWLIFKSELALLDERYVHSVFVVSAKHGVFTQGSTWVREALTRRIRGISRWEMRAPGRRASYRGARDGPGRDRPACSVPAGAPYLRRGGAGRGRRGGAAVPGTSRSSPHGRSAGPAAPRWGRGAAGSRAGGRGCSEGRRPLRGSGTGDARGAARGAHPGPSGVGAAAPGSQVRSVHPAGLKRVFKLLPSPSAHAS